MKEIFNIFCYQASLNMLYIGIYIVTLSVIIRHKDRLLCQTLALPVILAACTIFNPIFYEYVIKGTSVEGIFGRLFWFCTVFIVDAFALAWTVGKQADVKRLMLALAVCIVAVVAGGGKQILYTESENIYKIPQSIIEIDEKISEEKDEENPTIICNEEVFFYLRQYDPTVITYGNQGYLTETMRRDMGEEINSMYEDAYGFLTAVHGYSESFTIEDSERVIEELGIDFVCGKSNQLENIEFERYIVENIYAVDGQYVYKITKK